MLGLFDQDFHVIFGCFMTDIEIFHFFLSKETMDVNNSGQVHNVTVPRLKDDEMIMIHERKKTLACEKQDDVQHVFARIVMLGLVLVDSLVSFGSRLFK